VVYVSKHLNDCWRDCPRPYFGKEEAESADARFLQSIGVRFLDDDNP
jgi:hypothetical protein